MVCETAHSHTKLYEKNMVDVEPRSPTAKQNEIWVRAKHDYLFSFSSILEIIHYFLEIFRRCLNLFL